MAKLGRLHEVPASWKDYFFPIVSATEVKRAKDMS